MAPPKEISQTMINRVLEKRANGYGEDFAAIFNAIEDKEYVFAEGHLTNLVRIHGKNMGIIKPVTTVLDFFAKATSIDHAKFVAKKLLEVDSIENNESAAGVPLRKALLDKIESMPPAPAPKPEIISLTSEEFVRKMSSLELH